MYDFLQKIRRFILLNKSLGYLSLGNITGNIIGGLFWIILAGFVGPEIYGKSGYLFSVSNFISAIALIGLPVFVTTYMAKGYTIIRREAASIVLISSILAAVISYFIFQYYPLSILVFGIGFFSISIQDYIGSGLFKEYAITFIGQKIVSIIASLVLYTILGFDGIILGYAMSYLVAGYRTIFALRGFTLNFRAIREKKKFLIDSYGIDISRAISNNSDRFLIAPLFGFGILGLYQISVQILTLQAIIPGIMSLYLLREEARGVNRRYVKSIGFLVTTLLSIFVVIASPAIIPVIFPQFIESIPLIQIATWGAPIMALNAILGSKLLANEKSRPVLLSVAIFFVALASSMYYLGGIFGGIGLTFSLLIAISLQTLSNYIFFKKSRF